ncbi:hypothetical protein CJD36_003790 [Flavipsychrobacter stenotrophus]|uniref:Lipoprotein n=1 Tax=Flavipsychrobacter stenotrophus TaxID=2077091 RepID=A0A2S7T200_9BACT|nr:hypothetical protein [Flavipsychrobacter stenotrophus]PQJ12877.1 hypothetical protein CJD36_003790 [Flavipsychrobacter stenotrophus]
MRNKILIFSLGVTLIVGACTKQSHTTTTTTDKKYSTFNFTFDGTTYNNSLKNSNNHMGCSNFISGITFGSADRLMREFRINAFNDSFSVTIYAKKFDTAVLTGRYRIGDGIDSATQLPYSYGMGRVLGFTRKENSYKNAIDTTSSYLTITEYNSHEIKGTFVLKCQDSIADHNMSGDFDLITP